MAEPPLRDHSTTMTPTSPGLTRDPILGPSVSPPPATPPPGGPYAMPATGAGAAPSTRPTGVTILAVLAAIGAFFALMFGLAALAGGAFLGAMGEGGVGAFGALVAVAGVFALVYAVLAAAVAYGLLKRARWAWYITVVLVGLGLLGALVSLLSFDIVSFLFQVAINGFVLWYLMKPEVQAWFGVSYNTPWKYKTAGPV